jgi:hypothetical protein
MNNKYILIFFFLLLTIYSYKYLTDYERYLLDPYITVYARDGLNNKIRVILSFLYTANIDNKKLRIIWIKDDQCPDNFNNLFEPIDNVEFIYTNDIPDNLIDINTGWTADEDYIKNNYYKYLKPIKSIQNDINNTIKILKNDYISCHIRRTDIVTLQKYFGSSFNIHQDNEYITFINQYPKDLNIYIATDNQDTQQKFIDLYGDRIIYKKIDRSNNLRQTSLQDAVKDMYVCAGAKYFMGSPWSSFTDSINEIRKLNK